MVNDESTLIAELKAGRPEAFEKLVRDFSPRLLGTATRMLRNPDEAQDAVQDALISAWKNVKQFEGNSSLGTWLHRIVINASLSRMRSQHSKNEMSTADEKAPISAAFEGMPSAWTTAGPSLEKQVAMRRVIQRALGEIPEDFRVVLMLRDVEELSSKQVAEQLGIPDDTVRQRLHRARTIMAEMLRPELCSGPELTCGGQLDLLLDYIDDALPIELQRPVRDHIQDCPACSDLFGKYRTTIGIPRSILQLTNIPSVGAEFVAKTLGRWKLATGLS